MLIEGGLIGMFLALPAALLLGWEVIRRRPAGDRGPFAATPGWFASAAALALFSQALLDWTLSIPTIGAMFALFLGVALARNEDEVAAEVKARYREGWRFFGDAMLVPVAIGLVALCLLPLVAGLLVRDAERQLDDNPDRARWESALAWQLSPSGHALGVRTAAVEETRSREQARRVLLHGLARLDKDPHSLGRSRWHRHGVERSCPPTTCRRAAGQAEPCTSSRYPTPHLRDFAS